MHDDISDTKASPAASRSYARSPSVTDVDVKFARGRASRRDWRLGGRAVSRWDTKLLLAGLLVVMGVALASSAAIWLTGFWGGLPATPLLWAGLMSVSALAFARSRPAGLLRLRARDFLYGFAFGIILRFVQNGAEGAPFPDSSLLVTGDFVRWVFAEAIPLGFVGPIVEEIFFRAVILVTAYQTLRRTTGPGPASVAAALTSTGLFAALHGVLAPMTLHDSTQIALVGLTCSALVFLTGRLWAAVIAHVIYNCVFLLLVVVGSVLAR